MFQFLVEFDQPRRQDPHGDLFIFCERCEKNHHEENMYQESNHETLHSLMKSSSPIAKM